MYRLATCNVAGRRVLVLEDDPSTAAAIEASISEEGAIVCGSAPNINEAISFIGSMAVDLILVHTRYVADCTTPLSDVFRPQGVDVGFLGTYDDHLDLEDDPQVYG